MGVGNKMNECCKTTAKEIFYITDKWNHELDEDDLAYDDWIEYKALRKRFLGTEGE